MLHIEQLHNDILGVLKRSGDCHHTVHFKNQQETLKMCCENTKKSTHCFTMVSRRNEATNLTGTITHLSHNAIADTLCVSCGTSKQVL